MFLQEAIVKKLLALILVLGMLPIAKGQITLEVCEADGETLFDCNDVMVGTKLTLIVSSDSNDYWSGGLFIKDEDRALGTLAARDLDPNTRDWTGSHYEDAGELARVTAWKDSFIWGFDLYTFYPVDGNSEDNSTVPGNWFIIDYYADEAGECNVGFYDYSISWDDPNYYVIFFNVPTRDLNSDEAVNFVDFAIFASQWDANGCNDPNWCEGADIDRDGDVDHNDLGLFVEYWLWPTTELETIIIHQIDPNSQQMSGAGMDGMFGMQETQQTLSAPAQEIDIDEIVRFLEEIWVQEKEFRESISEAEWNKFIESVKNSYPQLQ